MVGDDGKEGQMSETQAAYDTDMTPFTREQIKDICRYLAFIGENGGHGEIVLKVRENKIKFINLGDIGRKYEALSE